MKKAAELAREQVKRKDKRMRSERKQKEREKSNRALGAGKSFNHYNLPGFLFPFFFLCSWSFGGRRG